jgi:diguanylate cyclase (GGDEF)-like protein
LAQRFYRPYTLALIDIDDFKHINDTLGHHAGDEALKTIANVISTCSRATDIKSRIGGEEFVIIFPETSLEIGLQQAQKLRKEIEQRIIHYETCEFKITVTIGVAQSNAESENFYDIMTHADNALYKGKRTGKNKVVTHQK